MPVKPALPKQEVYKPPMPKRAVGRALPEREPEKPVQRKRIARKAM